MKSYIRCQLCGGPIRRKGLPGRPPKHCKICNVSYNRESKRISMDKLYHNKIDYVHGINKQLHYQESKEVDYCNTPFGLYKVLGSRETTVSALNERERDLLEGTKDEKWRKKNRS